MLNQSARRLGVRRVQWVSFPFTKLVAGDRCPCDFDVNGVSILPDRRQRVDFSSPYFTANQGVLAHKGTAVTGAADARQLRFGVQEATSGAAYLEKVLRPTRPLRTFGSTTAAFRALRSGQVDAVMSDVPIVVDAAHKYPGLVVAGQFKTDEQYGAVLAKGLPQHQGPVGGDRPAPRRRRARPAVPEVLPRAGEHPAARLTGRAAAPRSGHADHPARQGDPP
jgi:polar amino acid transport system substrate-binding protein